MALSQRRLRVSGYLISMGTVNPQLPIIGNPLHPIVAALGFKKHLTSHFVHNRGDPCQPSAEAVQKSYEFPDSLLLNLKFYLQFCVRRGNLWKMLTAKATAPTG